MAREAAQEGRKSMREFYRSRSVSERKHLDAMVRELEDLIPAEPDMLTEQS